MPLPRFIVENKNWIWLYKYIYIQEVIDSQKDKESRKNTGCTPLFDICIILWSNNLTHDEQESMQTPGL